ncbi:OLC1v1030369C2 [Oldenlandia corymbosa var. corymbosa]|uniref:OLC1v1030369C2 n=1 Tax=Oldenlandia corymbosa var. corymbosa TaxID=529605 RepID=A0AAV1CGN9_OLDCO|nr:OLC1v1030369C2 [Oldenlandia corymbosa var. corymbosa]
MYQKGSGYSMDPFTAATEACRRRKKGGKNGRTSTATCFSPWSVISCWFQIRRSKHGTINLDEEDTEHDIAFDCLDDPVSSSNSALELPGDHKKEASFSLGVGIGLMYLMATNKNEISKLVELCQRMETMIQNFNRELGNDQRNDANISYSYSTPKAQIFPNQPTDHLSIQDCPSYSWEQENSNSEITSTSYQNSYTRVKGKGKKLEMDQLEAELEAELESLQLHLDDEVVLNYSHQNHSEVQSNCRS